MTNKGDTARHWLTQDFALRKGTNPKYSLRAYARDLGVSVGLISEAMSGKRTISYNLGYRIAPRLKLSHLAQKDFLKSLLPESAPLDSAPSGVKTEKLSDDHFRIIADWYHFAILSLARTEDCQSSRTWIAQRLGISAQEAELALARLRRVGLISTRGNKLKRTESALETVADLPSSAIKKSHRLTRALRDTACAGAALQASLTFAF